MFLSVPPATRALILINIGVYLLERVVGQPLAALFALWPLGSPQF